MDPIPDGGDVTGTDREAPLVRPVASGSTVGVPARSNRKETESEFWGRQFVPNRAIRDVVVVPLLVAFAGVSVWLVIFDAPWELRVLAWLLVACATVLPVTIWGVRTAAPDLAPKLLQAIGWLLVSVYFVAAASPTGVGWAWPVTIWPDLFSGDTVVVDVVQNKRVEHHTHCGRYGCDDEDHYWIRVGGHDWAVSGSTYQVLDRGELVEVAFRPHTKLLEYVAYGPALSKTRGENEVRLAVGLAPLERQVFEEQVLPIVKKRTGLDVSFVQIESDRLVDLLADTAGSPFDLLVVDNNRVGALTAKGLVQDLTDAVDLVPAQTLPALDAVTSIDGELRFLPFRPNVMVGYYNKSDLAEVGAQPPQTWDELEAVAHALKDHGHGAILQGAAGPPSATQLVELIWQAGGDPLAFDDPATVRAFDFLSALDPWLNDKTAHAQYDTVNDFLGHDKVSLAPNWAFGVRDLVIDHQRSDIGVYSGWSGPAGSAHVLGGDVIGIPRLSEHRKTALAVAQQLMSKNVQSILARELFWPSMRTDAYDTIDPAAAPYWDAINEALGSATARPTIACWSEVESILSDAWRDVAVPGSEVQETLDRYAPEVARLATSGRTSCRRDDVPRGGPPPPTVGAGAPPTVRFDCRNLFDLSRKFCKEFKESLRESRSVPSTATAKVESAKIAADHDTA